MEEAKVWIVTQGEYSDYSIRAVFDSRAGAEAFVRAVHIRRYGDRLGLEGVPVNLKEESLDALEDGEFIAADREHALKILHDRLEAVRKAEAEGL